MPPRQMLSSIVSMIMWEHMDEYIPILVTICNEFEGHKYVTISANKKLSLPSKANWSSCKLPVHNDLQFTKQYVRCGGESKEIYHACCARGVAKFEKRVNNREDFVPTPGNFTLKLYDGQHFGLDDDSEQMMKAVHCMYHCCMGTLQKRHTYPEKK
jgi:hypothetical protein